MNLFSRLPLAGVLALTMAVTVHSAAAQEQSFPKANCALTPPAGWRPLDLKQQPAVVSAYGDPAGARTLLVLVYERGKQAEAVSDSFAAEFDKGVEKSGGAPKSAGGFVQVAGFRAYERQGTATAKGEKMSTLMLVIPTGDGIYLLETTATQGAKAEGADIRIAVGSFHFLRPPGPPHKPRDAAYWLGYRMGQIFMGLLVLGALIWVVRKAVSGRRTPPMGPTGTSVYPLGFPPPPPGPPPLPSAGQPAPPPPPPFPPTP